MPLNATSPDVPIACNLSERDFARRGQELAETLFAGVREIRELPDGYAFRFPTDDGWLPRLAAFAETERRCCPFFAFEIAVEPNGGPVWLRLRGGEGVKAFVADTFVAADSSDGSA